MTKIDLGRITPVYKGDYDSTVSYNELDIVYDDTIGKSFIAKQASKGKDLPVDNENEYWGIIAKQGPKGTPGEIGPKGEPGKDGIVTDFGNTSDLLPNNSDTVVGKLNGEFTDRGLNVKWFGAVGDGIADDTKAFKDALVQAESTLNGIVLVPSGKFKITEPLDIPDRINLVGSGTSASIFMPTGVPYLFSAKAYSSIQNIRVNTQNNGHDLNVVELSGTTSTTSTTFRHITIMNGQEGFVTNGFYIAPEGNSNNSLAMVYPNTFDDIYMWALSNGVVIENKAFAFVNSNLFSNIVIRDYRESAIHIFASSADAKGVSSNEFSHIDIEGRSPLSPTDKTPFIMTTGVHNNFKNIVVWNDNQSVAPAILLGLDNYQKDYFSLSNNTFDGKVESTISIPEPLLKINDIKGIEINDWVNKYLNSSIPILKGRMKSSNLNRLPKDIISDSVTNYMQGLPMLMGVLPAGNQTSQDVVFSSDDISPYISIKQGGFLMIPMRGAAKQYTSQSQGFTVIFDVDIDNNVLGSASIYPSFGYYNPKTFGRKGFNRQFVQCGKIGTNTYRVSAYCTPIDDDLEGYDELYSSITVANSGNVKIRNAYIVGGLYSVNEPISEGNYATDFIKVVDSSTSIASYDDLGIFVPSKTSIVSDYYQAFTSSLLTEIDLGNGKKMLKYPIRL